MLLVPLSLHFCSCIVLLLKLGLRPLLEGALTQRVTLFTLHGRCKCIRRGYCHLDLVALVALPVGRSGLIGDLLVPMLLLGSLLGVTLLLRLLLCVAVPNSLVVRWHLAISLVDARQLILNDVWWL